MVGAASVLLLKMRMNLLDPLKSVSLHQNLMSWSNVFNQQCTENEGQKWKRSHEDIGGMSQTRNGLKQAEDM